MNNDPSLKKQLQLLLTDLRYVACICKCIQTNVERIREFKLNLIN